MARRRLLTLLTPAVVARDDFAAADTTVVEDHVASDGGVWAKHSTSGAGSASIDSGLVHNTNDTTFHLYSHSWTPTSADYTVEADFVCVTDNNASLVWLYARLLTANRTGYAVRYLAATNVWQLMRTVNGTDTQLGSNVSQAMTAGQRYRVALVVAGPRIAATVDGVGILAANDTTIVGPGRAGFLVQNQATTTTGIHLDNWQVRQ